MNIKVDEYVTQSQKWQDEIKKLREILLDCDLAEDFKWGNPCYSFQGANIVLVHKFKEYCALLFFKGALLDDPEGILVQQTKNTQAARQIRFRSAQEIETLESVVREYVAAAIEVEKSGLKIKYKETTDFGMPEEFQSRLDELPALKTAFDALTPGRQKAYLLHFSEAKQSATRSSRVEKYIPKILAGKGLNDCVCGLSRNFPTCDGSHKQLHTQ